MKNTIYLMGLAILFACSSPKENSKDESNIDSTIIESEVKESNIVGEEVVYSADGIEMKGYIAYDVNIKDPRPGILVVHEWWGHNEHSRAKADDLARMGYVALAVDMYGDGKQAAHPKEAGEFAGMVMGNLQGAKDRFTAAYDLLKSNEHVNPEKMGAVGYCFGGSVVLTMADMGMDLDAVAAIHSGVQLPVMPGKDLKARVLVCNGEADPMVSPEQAEVFILALEDAGADFEYISYLGVKHAFTNPEADALGAKFEMPLAYDAEADEDSWSRIKTLFATTF